MLPILMHTVLATCVCASIAQEFSTTTMNPSTSAFSAVGQTLTLGLESEIQRNHSDVIPLIVSLPNNNVVSLVISFLYFLFLILYLTLKKLRQRQNLPAIANSFLDAYELVPVRLETDDVLPECDTVDRPIEERFYVLRKR